MKNAQKTVLIVDDIPFVRKTLKQILTHLGFKIVGEAENGEEAVQQYLETRPDIVTMDLVMPMMNGIEATKRILHHDPHALIVILSGMTQENLVTEAIIAGAKDYIMKPFQHEDVSRILRQVIHTFEEFHPHSRTAGGAA